MRVVNSEGLMKAIQENEFYDTTENHFSEGSLIEFIEEDSFSIKSPEEIEAAIAWYKKSVKFDRDLCGALLKCVLNKKQNMIDEEIFIPKKKEEPDGGKD